MDLKSLYWNGPVGPYQYREVAELQLTLIERQEVLEPQLGHVHARDGTSAIIRLAAPDHEASVRWPFTARAAAGPSGIAAFSGEASTQRSAGPRICI